MTRPSLTEILSVALIGVYLAAFLWVAWQV